jgi:signal transduction histidine kinase
MNRPPSIRLRVALWTAALTAASLALLAVSSWFFVHEENLEAIDLLINAAAKEQLEEVLEDDFDFDEFEPWFGQAVLTADEKLISASGQLSPEFITAILAKPGPRTLRDGDITWRVVFHRNKDYIAIATHDLADFHEILRDLATAYGLILPLVALLAASVSWLLAGRSLRPVETLAEAAESIDGAAPDARLPDAPTEDEIGRLTRVLNAMLARIERHHQQARRFAGDASHELRTPLTIIKGELDKALASPELPTAFETTLLSAQSEAARMQQIIEHLLLLSRYDAGIQRHDREPLDLAALLRELSEDAELLSCRHQLEVSFDLPESLMVEANPAEFRRLLLNLIDNAAKYNRPNGRIEIRLHRATGELVEIEIANTGPLISPENVERVFDRFFQADEAHHDTGCGLGLSLCRETARAHGGDIRIRVDEATGMNHFMVTLPARA